MIRRGTIAAGLLAVVINAGFALSKPPDARPNADIPTRIRQEISTLPYSGIFDWVEAEVRRDGSVVLRGDVTRPSTKSDAESRIKGIESVASVVNEIHVLPLS